MAGSDFIIQRDDWARCRFAPEPLRGDLEAGQVLFRVDRFAFTSNNISYAAAGDLLQYWSFFPAEAGWGRIPAMGFGDVIGSRHAEVREGERVFGFFPMSSHLVIQADAANSQQFIDAAAHRRETAPAYRQYLRVASDPLYEAKSEDRLALLRGLFMTSFLVDDFLADADFFGARRTVIGSASSKTGIALAFLLAARARGPVVGLTSRANREFVAGLSYYDEVVCYDELQSLSPDEPLVIVDMSRDGEVVNALHRHYGENVRHSCVVGATHWNAAPRADDLPGAKPEFFFAPARIQKRAADWGARGLQERLGGAWSAFRDASGDWLKVVRGRGQADVERVYREVLEGRAKPSQGHVLSLHENS